MPIINGTISQRKQKIKAEINTEIAAQINAYCAWASIDDIGFFIEEAASFIFAKDRDWKQHKKAAKKRTQQTEKA